MRKVKGKRRGRKEGREGGKDGGRERERERERESNIQQHIYINMHIQSSKRGRGALSLPTVSVLSGGRRANLRHSCPAAKPG